MNKPMPERLKNAAARRRIARLQLAEARDRQQLRLFNEYDVLKSGNGRLRRVPSPEYQTEDDVLTHYKRGQAVALGRDLQRNSAVICAALNQFLLNVVGRGPKLRLHSKSQPDWTDGAAEWFNAQWAKRCDFRDDLHFAELIGILEMAIKREGDALWLFDDFGLVPGESPSGKLLCYEADQLVEVDPLPDRWKGYQQHRGVLFDKWGRRAAYAVSSLNGQTSVRGDDKSLSVFPAELCKHIKRVWRFNQVRGAPPLLAIAADAEDLYELQSKELQTSKALSTRGGTVTKKELADDIDGERGDGTKDTATGARYKNLEALMGGAIEYLDEGDEFKPFDWQRPALNFVESMDQLARKALAALGMSQTYSLLRVTSSYTAFRGEMLLAWSQFYADQKFLERHACDWTAQKALLMQYGGAVPADLSMSWDWPRMPAVDPLHEAQAVELLIKTLQTNYSEQLGPEWRARMEQLAVEAKTAKELGLVTVWEGEKQGLRFGDGVTRSHIGRDGE